MCFGGRTSAPSQPAPVQLPPAPQIQMTAPVSIQGAPKKAGASDVLGYKRRGKRALTIPMGSTTTTGA